MYIKATRIHNLNHSNRTDFLLSSHPLNSKFSLELAKIGDTQTYKLTMKLTLASLATVAMTVSQVAANFHVLSLNQNGKLIKQLACPSNYYNCDCFTKNDRAGQVSGNPQGDFFSVKNGLCGMPELNFYKRGDGHWDMYAAGGDGAVLGTCYSNAAETFCGSQVATDELVCYSYVCGQ